MGARGLSNEMDTLAVTSEGVCVRYDPGDAAMDVINHCVYFCLREVAIIDEHRETTLLSEAFPQECAPRLVSNNPRAAAHEDHNGPAS